MTDDKGAGEGPYGHRCYMQIDPDSCVACSWNDGHARGIREERERCAKIAEKEVVLDIASLESGEFYSNSAGRIIAEKIMGGQDAE